MKKRRSVALTTLAILLALVFMVGLVWANLFYVDLDPNQGNFLPRWLGTRLFLVEGQSPYSAETTSEIARSQAGGEEEPPGSSFYLYPFYSFMVYSPFALTANQAIARVVWMTLLDAALFACLGLSLSLSRWRAPGWMVVLLVISLLTFYYALRPLLNGDLSILVALAVVAALVALRADQDPLAGFLLALAMVKPAPVLLLITFVLIWAGVQRRSLVVWGFFGSLALLIAATSLLIPDWVVQNIRQLIQYLRLPLTNTPGTLIAYWLPGVGRQLGWLFTILGLVLLVIECGKALKQDFRWFFWTACLTLAVSPLIGIPTSLDNFIVMYPAVILVLATWDERWGRLGRGLALVSLLLLGALPWWLVSVSTRSGMPPNQNPWLFLFLPLFLLIGLAWVRWWAIHPPRLPVPEMAANLNV